VEMAARERRSSRILSVKKEAKLQEKQRKVRGMQQLIDSLPQMVKIIGRRRDEIKVISLFG